MIFYWCKEFNVNKGFLTALFSIVLLLSAIPAYSSNPVLLKNDTEKIPIGLNLEILEDVKKAFTIDDILTQNVSRNFVESNSLSPSYGFTDSAYWVRFDVVSEAKDNHKWLLELDFPLMDKISLFVPQTNNTFIENKYGFSFPFSQRDIRHRNFVFNLPVTGEGINTYYLRFENADRMEFPLTIWSTTAFQEKDHIEEFILGMYYGILLVMALFNFLIFISIKDKTYFYYVLYIITFALFQLNQNGLLYEFIYPDALNNHIVHLIDIIMLPCMILFIQSFLNTHLTVPRTHILFTVLKYLFLLSLIPSFFLSYAVNILIVNVLVVITAITTLTAGVILLIRRYRPAKFFMIAWSLFIAGALVYVFKAFGKIPNNYFTSYSIQIGSAFEVILLSLGLGDRINMLRNEKEAAQEKLILNQKHALDIQTKMTNAFVRFVPKEFLTFLNKKSIVEVELGNQVEKIMSVLFCDIRSFTSLSEKITPQENFNFLNSYLKRIGPIIRSNGGFIDKYIGDAVMALFPDLPENAIDAALLMQNTVSDYNIHRKSMGYEKIKIGIGIHTGNLMLGTIGEENRMESTVISDDVNLASRIESLTKYYGAEILISGKLFNKISDKKRYKYRIIDTVIVKGRNEPVTLIEILNNNIMENCALKLKNKNRLVEAIKLYREKSIKASLNIFKELSAESQGDDNVYEIYIKRCNNLLINGIPENWRGIEKLANK